MKLSIITVNLNNCEGLEKTINSVVSQQFTDYEFIVIDGGSNDGSLECIKAYQNHIHYWVSEPDKGIYNAMNKGIAQAKGDYCLFLNSGDWLVLPEVLKNVFSQPYTEDILIGNCNVSQNGKVVYVAIPVEVITLESFYKKTIPHQSTFIKRTLFETYGVYLEEYKIHSDYEFWLRTIIINNCSVSRINQVISDYNLEGISSDSKNNPNVNKEAEKIFSDYFPKRLIDDYEERRIEKIEMQELYWIKSHSAYYTIVVVINKVLRRLQKLFY